MNPKVIKVQSLNNYKLLLDFNNSEIRLFDVFPFLHKGIFRELQDLDYFHKVRLNAGSVCWPNEQDFSYDTLYLLSVSVEDKK